MGSKRKRYDASFKVKASPEAIKGELTISEIVSMTEVHSNQISKWKKQALEEFYYGLNEKVNRNYLEAENGLI